MTNETLKNTEHELTLTNGSELGISGVNDVKKYDDETIVLDTVLGELTLKGEGLKVKSFGADSGFLTASGTFYAFAYTSRKSKKSGIGRLF